MPGNKRKIAAMTRDFLKAKEAEDPEWYKEVARRTPIKGEATLQELREREVELIPANEPSTDDAEPYDDWDVPSPDLDADEDDEGAFERYATSQQRRDDAWKLSRRRLEFWSTQQGQALRSKLAGLSYTEIAKLMGLSVGTVKAAVHAARKVHAELYPAGGGLVRGTSEP